MAQSQELYDAILNGDAKNAHAATQAAIEAGAEPIALISESMVPAMNEVGRLFECEEYFVPELLLAGRAMKSAMESLRPIMVASGTKLSTRVVIGTVKGDLHDIGKNIVASMLEGGGFDVIDLGTNVSPGAVCGSRGGAEATGCLHVSTAYSDHARDENHYRCFEDRGIAYASEGSGWRRSGIEPLRRGDWRRRLQRKCKWRGGSGKKPGWPRSILTNRRFYLDLAARGLRMPIGADLILHEESEPEKARNNGAALGKVIERAARRWHTPLAIPLMDLHLEKTDLLALAGVPEAETESYHFTTPLDESTLTKLCDERAAQFCANSHARDEALAYIAKKHDLVAVGMVIGPFSLATRLLADPITVAAMVGSGVAPEDSNEVRLLWQCLSMAEAAVHRSLQSQMAHGAKAIMICEPAACTAFISPRQLKGGSNLFECLVMEPNLRMKAILTRPAAI